MSEIHAGSVVEWRAFGSGSKTLTCLHPIGLDGGWFDVFADSLGAEYRLLCPDMRGHGATPPPIDTFTLRDLVDDVVALWDSLEIDQSAVLGVSLGGMLGQGLVVEYPERVSAAILMCTTDGFDGKSGQALEERARKAAAPGGMANLVEPTIGRWFSSNAVSANTAIVRRARENLESQDGAVHARYWSAMRDLNFLNHAVWQSTPPPALVVAGSEDQSFPMTVAGRIAERIPGANTHIAPGEHLFPFEDPNSVSTLVLEFLSPAHVAIESRETK